MQCNGPEYGFTFSVQNSGSDTMADLNLRFSTRGVVSIDGPLFVDVGNLAVNQSQSYEVILGHLEEGVGVFVAQLYQGDRPLPESYGQLSYAWISRQLIAMVTEFRISMIPMMIMMKFLMQLK